jgi:dolichol-phosphate mannosyltransferase
MTPTLSIVLPVHNEAGSLPVLWNELLAVMPRLGERVEVIFVDDGSTDASTDIIRDLVSRDERVRLLRFERQVGLTAAFLAGLGAARGELLATMDSDLQSDPRDLELLMQHLDGADAVIGARLVRHDSWLKRVSSRVANAIRNWATYEHVADSACSLRVIRRACLAAWPPYEGMHRFVPTLLRLAGHRVVTVPVHHRERRFGASKFSVRNRALIAFRDLLAVAWMMRRRVRYRIVEDVGGGTSIERRVTGRFGAADVPAAQSRRRFAGATAAVLPVVLASALFLPAIGQRSIYHPDEARYAVLAKTMLETGDWLVPQINQELHFEKPPLFIWAIALISRLTGGVTAFSATLPAALAGIAGVLGTVLLGRRLFGGPAGLMAGLMLALTPGYFWHARLALADMMVTAFIVWSAWAFWRALDDPASERRWLAVFYVCVGLAVSAKGPAGLMPILVCGAFVLADRGVRGLRMFRPLMGVAILAVVWAPWAIAFITHGGAGLIQSVVVEDYGVHVGRWERFSELFFAVGPLGFAALPWSVFVPMAAVSGLRSGDPATRRKFWFLAAWSLAYVIAITAMTHKRDRYLLPVYPAIALMIGWLWSEWVSGRLPTALRRHAPLIAVFAVATSALLLLPARHREELAVWIPATLGRALPVVVVLLVAGALAYLACRAIQPAAAFTVLAAGMALVMMYETRVFVVQYNRAYDVRGFADRLAQRVRAADELLAFRYGRLAYDFYLGRSIPQIREPRELAPSLATARPVYVLTDERGRTALETTSKPWSVVEQAQIGGRAVLLLLHGAETTAPSGADSPSRSESSPAASGAERES